MKPLKRMELAKDMSVTDLRSTYFLKEPSMLEDFQKELRYKGLPKYYKAITDETSYNSIVKP